MSALNSSEMIFYLGIFILCLSAALSGIAAIVLHIARRHLRARLEAEYGKCMR